MSSLTITTPATLDPVSLIEAKEHCRVSIDDDDGLLIGYLLAARQFVEEYTGRALITRTYDLKIDDGLPCEIVIPRAPLISVTSVQYVDTNGATQTLSSALYQVSIGDVFGRIVPAYAAVWPNVRCQLDAVTVRFVAGYGSNPGDVPEPIRHAILLMVGHLYENREAVNVGSTVTDLPLGVAALLGPYRTYI